MLTAEKRNAQSQAYFQDLDGLQVQLGLAVQTPAGVELWGHDFNEPHYDLTDNDWLPLPLGTFDSFKQAADVLAEYVRVHQTYGDDL